jgi:hypothetical protein
MLLSSLFRRSASGHKALASFIINLGCYKTHVERGSYIFVSYLANSPVAADGCSRLINTGANPD